SRHRAARRNQAGTRSERDPQPGQGLPGVASGPEGSAMVGAPDEPEGAAAEPSPPSPPPTPSTPSRESWVAVRWRAIRSVFRRETLGKDAVAGTILGVESV